MKRIFRAGPPHCRSLLVVLGAFIAPSVATAMDTEREEINTFIEELATDEGFDRAYLEATLDNAEMQQGIIDAMMRPAEKTLTWAEYRAIFMTDKRIGAGVKFHGEHQEKLEQIAADTGVPVSMVLGIIGVESFFGRITGKHRVVDALATLGFDYPPRSKFFRSELGHVFRLAREEDMDILELTGSYAGAMGPPQFMPSSYRAYAVDGDGDGKRDLLNSWDDVMASVANYFVAHKWQSGQPVAELATLKDDAAEPPLNESLKLKSTVGELSAAGVLFQTELAADSKAGLWQLEGEEGDEYWVGFDNLYVITRYNRSVMYALAAWQLGDAIVRAAENP